MAQLETRKTPKNFVQKRLLPCNNFHTNCYLVITASRHGTSFTVRQNVKIQHRTTTHNNDIKSLVLRIKHRLHV